MLSLVKPQVSLNGTSREQLVEQQADVLTALRAVIAAMGDATPNGRDYQFRPAELGPAIEAWNERRVAVWAMIHEIEAHAVSIQEG